MSNVILAKTRICLDSRFRGNDAALLIAVCFLSSAFSLAGCVKRTLIIESDPPGAKVWINEKAAGVTPLTQEFITHGRYKFLLRKTGFEEVNAREMVRAPVYQWIPLDFVSDVLLPVTLQDRHHFRYTLVPKQSSEQPASAAPLGESSEELQASLEQLQSVRPEVRRAACLALARRRDPSTASALLVATWDPQPTVRIAALEALRAVNGKESLDRLAEVLEIDPNPEVRWRAASELEALGSPDAVPALIRALKDKDPLVRAGASEALKGLRDPRAVQPLLRTLRDKDTTARRAAAEALGLLGDRLAVKPLIWALRQHDFQTRRRAAKSLGQLGDPAASIPLAQRLDDWDPQIRRISSEALIQMKDPRPVPLLVRYLRSWKPATREEAAIALGGLKDPRALEPLRTAAGREPNERTRAAMQNALASLSEAGKIPS